MTAIFARLETGVEVKAPAAVAWELLTDTSRWSRRRYIARHTPPPSATVPTGSSGWVRTVIGLRLPFKVTEFEAGRRWCWEVAGIAATGHRVEEIAPDRCRVVFEVPLAAAPYLAICRLAVRRIKRILEKENRIR